MTGAHRILYTDIVFNAAARGSADNSSDCPDILESHEKLLKNNNSYKNLFNKLSQQQDTFLDEMRKFDTALPGRILPPDIDTLKKLLSHKQQQMKPLPAQTGTNGLSAFITGFYHYARGFSAAASIHGTISRMYNIYRQEFPDITL